MAVNIHCSACRSSAVLDAKACPKCGKSFLKERKYRVTVKTRDGRRITKVVESLQLARKLEAKFKTQSLEDRFFNIKPRLTVGEVWFHYLRWAKGNKKSWRTDELRWNKHVGHHLNVCPMDSVGPRAIVSIATAMKETGLSPASVKQVIVLIKRLYNWARQMDYYTGPNPAAKVPMPKLNNSRDAYLSREEISRLLATLDKYPNRCFSLLVKFALFTGLRRGELFKLRWVNVDLDFARVKLIDPKGGKDTILPLSDDAVAVLLDTEREARVDGSEFVFPNRAGQQRGWQSSSWTQIKRRAGLSPSFRFHDLRHTFASYMACTPGISIYTLQKLLTHKSPQMTQRYAHLNDATLRNAVNSFSESISSHGANTRFQPKTDAHSTPGME